MHYVCSDIHGRYEQFCKLLTEIEFSEQDELYVIGDTIDRGPRPVDVLMHTLITPNIHLIIGNHEHMMIRAAETKSNFTWLSNGAAVTIKQLSRYSEHTVKSIINTMKKLPIVVPDLVVDGRHFYLVHAYPPDIPLTSPLLYCDVEPKMAEQITWGRQVCTDGQSPLTFLSPKAAHLYKDHTFIVGHTPTHYARFGESSEKDPKIIKNAEGNVINIDCGCAQKKNLGCLRLEDMKEFYV